jgi:hypothetical protein
VDHLLCTIILAMNNSVFWGTMLCSLLKANQYFRGTQRLHILLPKCYCIAPKNEASCSGCQEILVKVFLIENSFYSVEYYFNVNDK